jgi:hypothetical protein
MKILSKYSLTIALSPFVVVLFVRQVMADDLSIGLPDVSQIAKGEMNTSEVHTTMKVHVTANSKTTVFELNNSQAAKDLYFQLPLSIKVEDYSNNEKIFYPPKKLNTTNTPQANAKSGTFAYYAPWGDVVMFYGDFGSAAGLYELGNAVSGGEHINEMTGTLRIEKDPEP